MITVMREKSCKEANDLQEGKSKRDLIELFDKWGTTGSKKRDEFLKKFEMQLIEQRHLLPSELDSHETPDGNLLLDCTAVPIYAKLLDSMRQCDAILPMAMTLAHDDMDPLKLNTAERYSLVT